MRELRDERKKGKDNGIKERKIKKRNGDEKFILEGKNAEKKGRNIKKEKSEGRENKKDEN